MIEDVGMSKPKQNVNKVVMVLGGGIIGQVCPTSTELNKPLPYNPTLLKSKRQSSCSYCKIICKWLFNLLT